MFPKFSIRYSSDLSGTFALYGRYHTADQARTALIEFARRAKEYGATRILRTMKIV